MARKRKYTPKVIAQVRRLHADGVSRNALAKRLSCDPSTVSRLVRWGTSDPRSTRAQRHYVPECIVIDVSRETLKLYTASGEDFVFHPLNNHTRKFVSFVLNKALRQAESRKVAAE